MKYSLNSADEKKKERNKTRTIFNPLSEDVVYRWNNGQDTYTIFAMETGTFPNYICDRLSKIIADRLVAKTGLKGKTPGARREEELKRIETDL